MVRLEGAINRYLGLSTDAKPVGDVANGEVIPPGSSFMETDTGRIARFDGAQWVSATGGDEQTQLLAAIYMSLDEILTLLRLQTGA